MEFVKGPLGWRPLAFCLSFHDVRCKLRMCGVSPSIPEEPSVEEIPIQEPLRGTHPDRFRPGVDAMSGRQRSERSSPKGWRLLGGLLLLVPLVPLAAFFADLPEAHGLSVSRVVPPREWLAGAMIFFLAGWVLSLPRIPERLEAGGRIWSRRLASRSRVVAVLILAVVLPCVSRYVFGHRPNLVDSVVQLFQARIYGSGALTAPEPPGTSFFVTQHMLFDGGRWYSQYPPGWPTLLVPGVLVGLPWLVPVLISLGTAPLLYAFALRAYDRTTARVTILLLALCPFFWFMGGSFMNHVPMLFSVAGFLWLFALWEDSGRPWALLAAGSALGLGFVCRPLTAAAIAAPFALFGVISASKRGRLSHLLGGAAGFLALAATYPLYNAATTGDPWVPGYIKLWGPLHGLGFHATPWGDRHTPLRGLKNELTDLQLLNLYAFEWPLPSLWPVGAGLVLGWLDEAWDRRLVTGFLVLPLAYFFYWHHDSYLGPRFLYSSLAFLLPLTARALVEAASRLKGVELSLGGWFRAWDVRRWVFTTLGLCLLWAVVYGIPGRWWVYASGLTTMKTDLRAQAREAGIRSGLIFVKVSAGNRLIARLRGLGGSAATVETAYRKVDYCDLLAVADSAASGGWSAQRLDRDLQGHVTANPNLVNTRSLNGDNTLLLRPSRLRPRLRLPPECADEIRYDRSGYGIYTPHLLANRPDLSGPLVVARDLRGRNVELEREFPDRPAYLYNDGRFTRLARSDPSDAGL